MLVELIVVIVILAILAAADDKPYMLIIGTGDYSEYAKTKNAHKAYTVYFVAYWSAKDKDPIFLMVLNGCLHIRGREPDRIRLW